MKQVINTISIICILLFITSCGSLRPVSVTQNKSLNGYTYFYVMPTSEINSISGTTINKQYYTHSRTINPSDLLAGHLMKKGFIRVAEIKPEQAKETFIVCFSESGRRNLNLGYSIEVTIQILAAINNEPLCIVTGEGQGTTEADDVRIAINRCMERILDNQ